MSETKTKEKIVRLEDLFGSLVTSRRKSSQMAKDEAKSGWGE